MSVSNPSHLLISRNPRSPAHPQLAPTLTSRHSHAGLPPNLTGLSSWAIVSDHTLSTPTGAEQGITAYDALYDDHPDDGRSSDEEEEEVDIHPTFTREAAMPGTVKVIVGRYTFWCHKEVLWFASPFFQSLLEGNWAETNMIPSTAVSTSPSRRESWLESSSPHPDTADKSNLPEVDDHPDQAPDHPDDESVFTERNASIYLDAQEDGPSVAEILDELRKLPESRDPSSTALSPTSTSTDRNGPSASDTPSGVSSPAGTPGLLRTSTEPVIGGLVASRRSSSAHNTSRRSATRHSFSSGIRASARADRAGQEDRRAKVDAVVKLHEESASAFQDFLFWCYPHLECRVTWTNVENLLALSLKLLTPPLKELCERFLITHASGRPVVALMLAERYGNASLFREASRFVLDQPTWDKEEMEMLDEQTQLRLSQRRNWFLERLLKLGTIDVKREYTCRPDCPDPARCQLALDEKWRQAHSAVCRYGPPQPSVAYSSLRQLDTSPTNPSLAMPHPSCQRAAHSWVITLFDRMFQLKNAAGLWNPGTEKYWLWIPLK